jgi:RNA polymerase sigma-70 factor (ECF subfamily)
LTGKAEKGGDTTLGGDAKDFPPTTQGFLEHLLHPQGARDRRGVEELCRRYWKPVYFFIRVAWAKSSEDAKDLTQEFFAWLLEGDVLVRYETERAPFRTFLKAVLRRFIADQRKAAGRQKRGGGRTFVRLEEDERALEGLIEDARAPDPEKAFDQAWLVTVLKSAVEAVRAKYAAEGRAPAFRLFEECDLSRDLPPPSYAELAARHGLAETQVRHALAAVRRAVREAAAAEIAGQTGSREQFEEEWRAFLGA